MATSPNGTPMRKNARANRERILAAAEAVFGASGELGSTEDVADRAGVGIATVFRHFPTKEALIEATLVRQFDRLNEQASRLADGPDPGRAVRQLIVTLIETSSTKLTLISPVGESGPLPRPYRKPPARSRPPSAASSRARRTKAQSPMTSRLTSSSSSSEDSLRPPRQCPRQP